MTLDDYFKLIIKPTTQKETTMFEKTKMFFTEQIEKINSLLTKPTAFVQEEVAYEDGYWAFEMYTPKYTCDGEVSPEQHDLIIEPDEYTWMGALDKILDVMGKHYGYDIKEQVYYSVHLPLNIEGEAGYGRSLNDEVLQKLLLSNPEVYEVSKPE